MNRRGRVDSIPFIVAFEAHYEMAPGQVPRACSGAVLPTIAHGSARPDDIKADIARVVRSIKFTGSIGGDCLLRAGIGYVALGLLGFRPQVCVGGMLFRAGPDQFRDTLAFCGPGNAGQMIDDHFFGHVWLELDGDLIDFSCGDWPHLDPRSELRVAGMELPPVRWQASPPTFVWATRGLFDDWRPDGSPPISELWYGPWTGARPDNFTDALDQVERFGLAIAENLVRMDLPDRIRLALL
jgi:hypothetical protein